MSDHGVRSNLLVAVAAAVPPDRIGFCKFIIEAYDNLAVLSTVDEVAGHVVVRFSAENQAEVFSLLNDLGVTLLSPAGET